MNRLPIADPTKSRPASKCMRVLAAVICFGIAAPRARAQTGNANQGVRIIKGSWGTAPGQYGLGMYGGEQEYPLTFVVDSSEHIYVLDELNNRVQHYDSDGNLLGEIPIQSDAPPTEIQKKKDQQNERSVGVDPIERGIEIGGMGFVDGALYAVQEIAYMGVGGRPKENLLKMQGGQFTSIAASSETAKVMKIMTGRRSNRVDIAASQKNLWVITGDIDKKYSATGKLLFQGPKRSLFSSVIVAASGNYYLMSVYTDDSGDPLDFKGIQITRYQTK